ncbi:MAG: LemA family protein [Bacillota bacterium]|nr:LemA family protein [Bacillota bacterium]
MKSKTKVLIAVIAVIVLIVVIFAGEYNSMVSQKTNVENSFSNISVQLQRRADLIPNLVNTVKGYAAHETSAINSVTSARAKLAGAKTVQDMDNADNELSGALSRLLVVVENYPNLKADTQFTSLMDELSGTENRISVARKDYNNAATNYNRSIRSFPKNIFAGMFGFKEVAYFQANGNANTVPNVQF